MSAANRQRSSMLIAATLLVGPATILSMVAFSETTQASCLAANQWAYASCGRYSSGYRSSGGYNYGAAAAAGVAVLGALIEHAEAQRVDEQNRQNAAHNRQVADENARRAARAEQCRRAYQNALAANDRANRTFDSWDPGGAITLYKQAISQLSICGDTQNIAIVNRNLAMAEKQYAAFRPDNRVNDAQARFADQNIYSAPNPFAAPRKSSGASAGAPSSGAGAKPEWDGYPETCEYAGEVARNTAAWFDTCVWDGKKRPERYQPSINPQQLATRARAQCTSAPADDRSKCVAAAKVRIIMNEDAAVRQRCSGAAEQLLECVDIAFVYGPHGEAEHTRVMLRWAVAQLSGTSKLPPSQVVKGCNTGSPSETCRPYGASSSVEAEPNRTTAAARSQERADPPTSDTFDLADYRSRLFDDVASAAVASAISTLDTPLTSEQRKTCVHQAFLATRSYMAGMNQPVPAACAAVLDVAKSRVAYYAAARVDTGPSERDDPLADYLKAISSSSRGLNSGDLTSRGVIEGLTPDDRMRAQGKCLLEGNAFDKCTR